MDVTDPGDEHHDAPPQPRPTIDVMLEEWEAEDIAAGRNPRANEVSRDLFDFLVMACYMRECCAACALEANGEDGS